MDVRSLFCFQSTCKTFMKLVDEYPVLYRKGLAKDLRKPDVAYYTDDKSLREAVHTQIVLQENIRRQLQQQQEQEKARQMNAHRKGAPTCYPKQLARR